MTSNIWLKGITLTLVAVSIFSCGNKKNVKQNKLIERPKAVQTTSPTASGSPSSGNATTTSSTPTTTSAEAPQNATVVAQAAEAGLSISWNSTEVLEESGQHAVLLNQFTFNSKVISINSTLDWSGLGGNGDIKNCSENDLPYSVDWNDKQTGPDFWAVGKTVCLIDGEVHVGLDFFAWNGNKMLAEKVLLNITDATLATQISKEFNNDGNRQYLINWVIAEAIKIINL